MLNKIRIRFVFSFMGYMYVGNLRIVFYVYFIVKYENGDFILRIEDID